MTSDIRRRWPMALAALLLCSSANLIGSVGQAADDSPAEAGDAETQAIADRLDAMLERATARLGQRPGGETDLGDANADATALRARLDEAETQIRLLKNVVIQSLRAQSAAEDALRREQAAAPPSVTPPEAEPAPTGSEDLMLAEQVEALTDTVRRLRVDVDALRSRAPSEEPPQPDRESALRPSGATDDPESTGAGEPLEEDAMLPEAGMGGRYQPWNEDEPAQSSRGAQAAVPSDEAMSAAGEPIKVAEVHFNSGSAQLTPGGERRTLDAIERIRSMEPAKVRVVAFTDRVGDSAYNLVLSKERALSVAAVLERTGLPREMVEVVGSGEEGVPVPTPDGVPEPLNRSAGIFVVRDGTGWTDPAHASSSPAPGARCWRLPSDYGSTYTSSSCCPIAAPLSAPRPQPTAAAGAVVVSEAPPVARPAPSVVVVAIIDPATQPSAAPATAWRWR